MIAGLYRRYAPELVRYIRKYTEDQAAAEDIVQETFVRGMEHGSQLDVLEESQRRAWLYRTAKNICIDRARRVQAEPPWEGETFQNDDLTKPMVMQLCGIWSRRTERCSGFGILKIIQQQSLEKCLESRRRLFAAEC